MRPTSSLDSECGAKVESPGPLFQCSNKTAVARTCSLSLPALSVKYIDMLFSVWILESETLSILPCCFGSLGREAKEWLNLKSSL